MSCLLAKGSESVDVEPPSTTETISMEEKANTSDTSRLDSTDFMGEDQDSESLISDTETRKEHGEHQDIHFKKATHSQKGVI